LFELIVGASTTGPNALNFLYENSEEFRVLPTFAVVPTMSCMYEVLKAPSLDVNFTKILHGEQFIEIDRPFPSAGDLTIKTQVVDVMDKGSGAVYVVKGTSHQVLVRSHSIVGFKL
jgi:3-hydroxyacyl-CoA dehydrogenase/3a,7a,12a-trihydroxy-5b-cholest-24-enoyl-CoA hydratase